MRKKVGAYAATLPWQGIRLPHWSAEEHEIKYGQTGLPVARLCRWRAGSLRAQTGKLQPVINYTNDISPGLPRVEPLLYARKQFREARLKATCFYADDPQPGGRAMSYFGELFTAHDAIYATSVAEQLLTVWMSLSSTTTSTMATAFPPTRAYCPCWPTTWPRWVTSRSWWAPTPSSGND